MAEKAHEPLSLGAANFMKMVAASMILLAVLIVTAVSASADLPSATSSPVDLATMRHASVIGPATSTASYQRAGQDVPAPCSDHSGSYQCCGTHCPCPSATVISDDTTGLGATLVPASGLISTPYLPAGSVKSPAERPPR